VDATTESDDLTRIDAYWRAANYLSVGQIYLRDNALLREPLRREHIKSRLLGHWGTTPGLNFVYAHLNRVIRKHDLDVIYVFGPGHGGPAAIANAWLERTYSEVYPDVSLDERGMKRLFAQFSFPGGVPSHVAPETPGSIHEGGELGYALSHAYGAVFDNPELIAACVIGDGEAETGPLATSWHSNKFLNPARDGVVLPILHLNGYKIAGPTVLARIPHRELEALLRGYGHDPYFVEGSDPDAMHVKMAATLDEIVAALQRIRRGARAGGATTRPAWPMLVLRSPKGWTGPREVDGVTVEGSAVGVGDGVPQLAALVDRARHLRCHMARHTARERELREEPRHPARVERHMRVHLGVGLLEPRVRDRGGTPVAGTEDVDHVEIVLPDDPVQMRGDEVQSGRRSPMTE